MMYFYVECSPDTVLFAEDRSIPLRYRFPGTPEQTNIYLSAEKFGSECKDITLVHVLEHWLEYETELLEKIFKYLGDKL